jgi:hypothetical protein
MRQTIYHCLHPTSCPSTSGVLTSISQVCLASSIEVSHRAVAAVTKLTLHQGQGQVRHTVCGVSPSNIINGESEGLLP